MSTSIGVRQGAPSSCLLFVIYIDHMIKMLKQAIQVDGFLGSLHCLLLMDDAVILATSREMCFRKLHIVLKYCDEYGMVLNEKKSKFFVINGHEHDKISFHLRETEIQYCPRYLYLGAWITDDGKMGSVISLHETQSTALVNKFSIFCTANTSMPYIYKKKVFDAAVTSSLLYSSETWLTDNPKRIVKKFNMLVRCLLGVRKNTSLNLCLVEAGIPPVEFLISKMRKNFLESKMRSPDLDEPFHYVFELCKRHNTRGYKFLNKCRTQSLNTDSLGEIRDIITNKPDNATKYVTYRTAMNPDLSVHEVYKCEDIYIPDYLRIAFTE